MVGVDTIIWDWNGTLLNDVDICIETINQLLVNRNHNSLNKDRYREIFTFPVRNYYAKAGFDFSTESFDKIAMEFIKIYQERLKNADVHEEARFVLSAFRENGYHQYLLSAMEHEFLVSTVKQHEIFDFFDGISGIHNHYAEGKTDMAKMFISESDISKDRCCLIGDTIHDHEVAAELGIPCILVANGHQSNERLVATGRRVVADLLSAHAFFNTDLFDIILSSNENCKES